MIRVVFTFIFILLSIGLVNFVDAQSLYNNPVVVFQTNLGDIVIELFVADAEEHVNFVFFDNAPLLCTTV